MKYSVLYFSVSNLLSWALIGVDRGLVDILAGDVSVFDFVSQGEIWLESGNHYNIELMPSWCSLSIFYKRRFVTQ